MNKQPRVVFETPKMRVVLGAQSHHHADKIYTIEESTRDAMGVATWKCLDQVTVRRHDDLVTADRKLLIELLEEKERL